MYISIDMTALCFLHKHASIDIVSGLDFIRCKHDDTSVLSLTDYQGFDHFADKQLSTLYKNMTGQTPTYFGNHLRMALLELAEKFPPSDADEKEVNVQCLHLEARNKDGVKGFYYAKGSFVPTEAHPVLFPKIPFTAEDDQNAARKLAKRTAQLAPHASATPVAPTASTAIARPAARPRTGVCAQIWEVLDTEQAAGRSTERHAVKVLAVTHGWNSSTASVQSALWRKAKTAT